MAKKARLTTELLGPDDPLEVWDRFVDRSPQGCIFCRSWWLAAVCGSDFQILVVRQGDEIVAGMPLPRTRKLIWRGITMPPLTQTLGVLLAPQDGAKYVSRLSDEMAVLRALVDAIPAVDVFRVNTHHTMTNWLPFHWAGYSQTTRYTYVLDDLSDLEAVSQGMAPRARNTIRKAEKAGIRVDEIDDVELLLALVRKTFARQDESLPYTEDDVRRLDAACAAHGARTIFVARDDSGQTHAALYAAHDGKCMYDLMQGCDPELRSSGANPLATWRSIERAHELELSYDFEGSMLESVESFFRSFGAVQKPYFEISRVRSVTAQAVLGLRQVARCARHRLRAERQDMER